MWMDFTIWNKLLVKASEKDNMFLDAISDSTWWKFALRKSRRVICSHLKMSCLEDVFEGRGVAKSFTRINHVKEISFEENVDSEKNCDQTESWWSRSSHLRSSQNHLLPKRSQARFLQTIKYLNYPNLFLKIQKSKCINCRQIIKQMLK